MLRLHTFGGLFLERDGVRVEGTVAQRKRLAMLAVLAAEPRAGVTRDKLAALLWPEADGTHSRNALHQAVTAIRRDLGSDVLIGSSAGDLRLHEGSITSDLGDFFSASASQELERAVDVYAGPFLDGVHLRDTPDFERWTDDLRRECAARNQDALGELARRATTHGAHAVAARWLRRLAEADPLSAPVTMRLMEALAGSNERAAAIQQGRIYIELVRAELDAEPDARVVARMSELARGAAGNGASTTVVAAPPQQAQASDVVARGPPGHVDSSRAIDGAHHVGDLRRRSLALAGVVMMLVLTAASLTFFALGRRGASEFAVLDRDRVVVADFENRTGDSTFNLLGATLADWVTQGLTQSGVARIVDPESRSAVRQFNPQVAALTGKERAVAMARVANAGTVVSGTISRQGKQLFVRAQITDLVNDRILVSLDPIVAPRDDAMRGADELRDRIVGALASAFDTRITSMTLPSGRTPTFAAYQEYILGLEAFLMAKRPVALKHFSRASQLDTSFALPLIWAVYTLLDDPSSDSVVALLARRRPPPGTLDDLQLQFFQTKDPIEEFALLQRGARLVPGSVWSLGAGGWLRGERRLREALQYYREIDPEHGWARTYFHYWAPMARTLHELGEHQELLELTRRYFALVPNASPVILRSDISPYMRVVEVMALTSLGRLPEVRRRLAELVVPLDGSGCLESSDVFQQIALEFRAHGHPADADSLNKRWIGACRRDVARESAGVAPALSAIDRLSTRIWLGVALYRNGEFAEAERTLKWSMTQSQADSGSIIFATGFLGRIAAKRGDRAAAERAMHSIERVLYPHKVKGVSNGDMMYAAIAAMLGENERALQRLVSPAYDVYHLSFHRDPDYEGLWHYQPFVAFATPR